MNKNNSTTCEATFIVPTTTNRATFSYLFIQLHMIIRRLLQQTDCYDESHPHICDEIIRLVGDFGFQYIPSILHRIHVMSTCEMCISCCCDLSDKLADFRRSKSHKVITKKCKCTCHCDECGCNNGNCIQIYSENRSCGDSYIIENNTDILNFLKSKSYDSMNKLLQRATTVDKNLCGGSYLKILIKKNEDEPCEIYCNPHQLCSPAKIKTLVLQL
jgi:hypothetical protein